MARSSDKPERILAFIRTYYRVHSRPPTVRDIQKGCGISSTSVVDYNLRILEARGQLRREPSVSRGISPVEAPRRRSTTRIPLLGTIAAGSPIPVPQSDSWVETPLDVVEVPREMIGARRDVYALKVKGTSMIDALVDDGDIVLVQATSTAEDGTMVVAWLKAEREVTLKRLYREGTKVRLQPAHPTMQPLRQDAANVEVQGRVIGVLRRTE